MINKSVVNALLGSLRGISCSNLRWSSVSATHTHRGNVSFCWVFKSTLAAGAFQFLPMTQLNLYSACLFANLFLASSSNKSQFVYHTFLQYFIHFVLTCYCYSHCLLLPQKGSNVGNWRKMKCGHSTWTFRRQHLWEVFHIIIIKKNALTWANNIARNIEIMWYINIYCLSKSLFITWLLKNTTVIIVYDQKCCLVILVVMDNIINVYLYRTQESWMLCSPSKWTTMAIHTPGLMLMGGKVRVQWKEQEKYLRLFPHFLEYSKTKMLSLPTGDHFLKQCP